MSQLDLVFDCADTGGLQKIMKVYCAEGMDTEKIMIPPFNIHQKIPSTKTRNKQSNSNNRTNTNIQYVQPPHATIQHGYIHRIHTKQNNIRNKQIRKNMQKHIPQTTSTRKHNRRNRRLP